ncbi:ABC transporter permease [Litchfieldia salsa]|uniref:Transport permease protein n=1 Tax=Litchfieldia salsa TaxID=930152 RepID=A0A1H0W5E8_9BACI|nr:ABC transporter permease [Litchfieldia salsa]SDP85972.1 ABC-2 type transport system permease protein [Litchfieldia salsa]
MSKEKTPFSFTRYASIVKKEIIQIKKDPGSLAIAIVLPVMLLFLLGYAVSSEIDNIEMVVWDQNQTAESRSLIQSFENSRYFLQTGRVQSYDEIEKMLDQGDVSMALIIPRTYSNDLLTEGASVQILIDGSDPTVSKTALSNSKLVVQNKSIQIQSQLTAGILQPVKEDSRVLYNPTMEVMNFNIPALIGLILQEVILLLTAFSLVREKERGTMEQLIVTPIKSSELILGKLTPYIGIGLFSFLLVLITALTWFGVPVQGSMTLLIGLSILFMITTLAMGILVSTLAKNQLQAMHMAFAIILPSVILSGFVFPREPMPLIIQALGGFIPLTYYLEILRGIFLKGIGLEELWSQTLILIGFTVLLCVITTLRFKKNLE